MSSLLKSCTLEGSLPHSGQFTGAGRSLSIALRNWSHSQPCQGGWQGEEVCLAWRPAQAAGQRWGRHLGSHERDAQCQSGAAGWAGSWVCEFPPNAREAPGQRLGEAGTGPELHCATSVWQTRIRCSTPRPGARGPVKSHGEGDSQPEGQAGASKAFWHQVG